MYFFLPIVILSISDFISQEYPVNILRSFYFGFFKQLHRAITLGKNLSKTPKFTIDIAGSGPIIPITI